MPYIKQYRRDVLKGKAKPYNAGELNFKLTSEILEYIDKRGPSYAVYNDVIGVLECLKLELYRRAVAPYEDSKIEENGDVFSKNI